MNTHKFRVSVLMLLSVLLGACTPAAMPPTPTTVPPTPASPTQAPTSAPTVTINGDQCNYEGPRTIPSKVTFTLKLETPIPSTPQGFAFVRLAEGKTLEDLKTVTTWDHPEWVIELGHYGTTEAGTWTHDFDWALNGAYHGEPIFVLCGIGGTRRAFIGAFGPIEVKP